MIRLKLIFLFLTIFAMAGNLLAQENAQPSQEATAEEVAALKEAAEEEAAEEEAAEEEAAGEEAAGEEAVGDQAVGDEASPEDGPADEEAKTEKGFQGTWKESLEEAQRVAAINGQPVFIKFEAEWCGPCQKLNEEFKRKEFSAIGESCVLLKIDIDRQPGVADTFDVNAIPAIFLVDSSGETLASKRGYAELEIWIDWYDSSVKGTQFEMPDVLQSDDPPTRTEVKDLIERLASRDAAMRQLTMERLAAHPGKTRVSLVDALSQPGKLEQKLCVLEVLDRWNAPIDGLDPWSEPAFTAERLEKINQWKDTSLEDLPVVVEELTPELLAEANAEIDRMLVAKNLRSSLPRLTRFGTGLLPAVTERLRSSETDQETERLLALRYWLTASNELRLGWFGGLVELASSNLTNRRAAVQVLIDRASLIDEPLLLELFADSDPLVRELSLKGLQQIGVKQTDATLARLLNDPDKNVRAAVLKQFAESEATHMSEAVGEYLKQETDIDLIVHALRFMRMSEGDQAINAVLPFVDNEHWQVRAEVAETLGEIDADDLSEEVATARETAVMKLLGDSDGFVVSKAAASLPRKKSKEMLEQLTNIAISNPPIAEEIVKSILEANYYSYGEEKTDLKPFLKKLVKQDVVEVRRAGAMGLVAESDGELTDKELVPLLEDVDAEVRVAGLTGLLATFDENRQNISDYVGQQSAGYQETYEYESPPSRSILGSIVSGLFGSRRARPAKPMIVELEEGESEEGEAEEGESEEGEAEEGEAEEGEAEEGEEVADDKEPEKPVELKLPELKVEEWLVKWNAGEIKIKNPKSIALLDKMTESQNADERNLAFACKAIMGDEPALKALMDLATEEESVKEKLLETLVWLPSEKRVKTFLVLAEEADTQDEIDSLLDKFTEVRNPNLANVVWDQTGNEAASLMTLRQALLSIYFGNAVSYYSDAEPEDVAADLRTFVLQDIEKYLDDNATRQKLVLISIQQFDLKRAKELAERLEKEGADAAVKDLAFRIKLKPFPSEGDRYDRPEPDRTFAVKMLDTDEPYKFSSTLKFLALGEEAIADSTIDDVGRELRLPYENYYYSHSSDESEVKVRIPKPPEGLTKEMLDRKDLVKGNSTAAALVAYFQSLLGEKPDLMPLSDMLDEEGTEEIAELMYQAIAMQNDDSQTPILEEIYEDYGEGDNQFSAGLYWTIRTMEGAKVIALRKRIRDEIGMDNLKNY